MDDSNERRHEADLQLYYQACNNQETDHCKLYFLLSRTVLHTTAKIMGAGTTEIMEIAGAILLFFGRKVAPTWKRCE